MSRIPALAITSLIVVACATTPHLEVGPVPAGVVVDSRLQYYEVSAASLTEIRQAMRQEGPRSEGRVWSAVTNWRLNWTYQYANHGTSGCELRRVHVRVQAVVTFPRWNPTAEPDSSLLAWWQQFNAGLAEHERGHAVIAVKAGGDIVRSLEGMTGIRCDLLGTQANAVGERLLFAAMTQQREYDRTTRHGQTQIQQAGRLQEP
jgi:predicted secreted Zn-dependent protease